MLLMLINRQTRNAQQEGNNITYSESMFVALFIQHVIRMCPVLVLCLHLRFYIIFPHYRIKGTIFGTNAVNIQCVF
jgi:hypothetical protein